MWFHDVDERFGIVRRRPHPRILRLGNDARIAYNLLPTEFVSGGNTTATTGKVPSDRHTLRRRSEKQRRKRIYEIEIGDRVAACTETLNGLNCTIKGKSRPILYSFFGSISNVISLFAVTAMGLMTPDEIE